MSRRYRLILCESPEEIFEFERNEEPTSIYCRG
jgi:hypothetical protein